MRILLILALVAITVAGCAPKGMYYWGDYSVTLYDLKKDEDDKTLKAHKEQLLVIMTKSASMNKRVPPGVQAEYGYYLLKEGKEAEGMEYLGKEMSLYPESQVFIQKLKSEFGRGKK